MGCLGGNPNLEKALKGRNQEQQKVIRYFYEDGGCFGGSMSDEEYEGQVMTRAKSMDFKKKALGKLGLDEDQVKEVEPIHLEGYYYSHKKDKTQTRSLRGKDDKWRSSAYQITWIFLSSTQVFVYQYTFNMDEDSVKEKTLDYFFKDVTSFSATSETYESKKYKKSCTGSTSDDFELLYHEANLFILTVPGDKLYCAMELNDYTERAIQGMKAKLREKKEG